MVANYFEWMHACVLKPDDGVVDPIVDKPPQVVGERKVEEICKIIYYCTPWVAISWKAKPTFHNVGYWHN